ncbi:hypothetical protein AB9P05_16030 [Roseivirga sp. BDSF3-8]|uniref:hypothetical protein n=1 Tax=Roseivirga sp. BDSF3-8 TaxID=3241598 RepID=UPI00353184B5
MSRELDHRIRQEIKALLPVNARVQELFQSWQHLTNDRFTFSFIDYLNIPFIKEVYNRNLKTGKGDDELVADHQANMKMAEKFALVIFLLVVEDVYPDLLCRLKQASGLNPIAISITPDRWEEDGLMKPVISWQELGALYEEVSGLFIFSDHRHSATEVEQAGADLDFSF